MSPFYHPSSLCIRSRIIPVPASHLFSSVVRCVSVGPGILVVLDLVGSLISSPSVIHLFLNLLDEPSVPPVSQRLQVLLPSICPTRWKLQGSFAIVTSHSLRTPMGFRPAMLTFAILEPTESSLRPPLLRYVEVLTHIFRFAVFIQL